MDRCWPTSRQLFGALTKEMSVRRDFRREPKRSWAGLEQTCFFCLDENFGFDDTLGTADLSKFAAYSQRLLLDPFLGSRVATHRSFLGTHPIRPYTSDSPFSSYFEPKMVKSSSVIWSHFLVIDRIFREKVVRIFASTSHQLEFVRKLERTNDFQLDFWRSAVSVDQPAEIRILPQFYETFTVIPLSAHK